MIQKLVFSHVGDFVFLAYLWGILETVSLGCSVRKKILGCKGALDFHTQGNLPGPGKACGNFLCSLQVGVKSFFFGRITTGLLQVLVKNRKGAYCDALEGYRLSLVGVCE